MGVQRILDGAFLRSTRDAVSTVKAIAFLGAALVGGSAAISYLLQSHLDKRQSIVIGIGGILLALITAIGCGVYIRRERFATPYVILKCEGTLEIKKVQHYHSYVAEKRWLIEAARDDVRLAQTVAHWTGQSSKVSSQSESLISSHDLFVASHPEEDGRIHHWIYFGRPLYKGERANLGIWQTFEDDARKLRPYYREGVGSFSAKELTVTARFSLSDDPAAVRGLVWNKDRKVCGELSVDRKVDHGTGKVDYIVSAVRTKRRHSYGLRWD